MKLWDATLRERLFQLRRLHLSTSDLARLLDQPWATVRTWEQRTQPDARKKAWLHVQIDAIEARFKKTLPGGIPYTWSRRERTSFLQDLKDALVPRDDLTR